MFDVTALGELLIDFAPKSVDAAGYPTLAANPGGAPGNFLAALNKYGCSVAMIGKVGDDMFGRLLLNTLKTAGIETRGVVVGCGAQLRRVYVDPVMVSPVDGKFQPVGKSRLLGDHSISIHAAEKDVIERPGDPAELGSRAAPGVSEHFRSHAAHRSGQPEILRRKQGT